MPCGLLGTGLFKETRGQILGGLWAEAEAETVPCLLERKQVGSLAENHGHDKA